MTIYLWTLVVDHDQLVKQRKKFYKHKYLLEDTQYLKLLSSMEREDTESFHFIKI